MIYKKFDKHRKYVNKYLNEGADIIDLILGAKI